MTINDCIFRFNNYHSGYCAQSTIDYYDITLHLFSRYLILRGCDLNDDIALLPDTVLQDYVSYLRKLGTIKNTSIRTYIRGVKVFFNYLRKTRIVDIDYTLFLQTPRLDASVIMPLTGKQVNNLLSKIDNLRNVLIFRLMLDCGLRVSEVCNLDYDDINFDGKYIVVRNSKYNKSRVVPLPGIVRELIKQYYKWELIPFAENPLVRSRTGGRLTPNAIKQMFYKLKKYHPAIHCHLLRHTFATSFILGGGSLEILRVLMGHSDYNVTRNYLHISSQLKIIDYDIYQLDGCMFRDYILYNKRE